MSINGYLGLPTKIPHGKILCYVTGKLREDTKEEQVRQRVARSLVEEYGYNKSDLDINFRIKIGSKRNPIDIGIFHEGKEHAQENIYIIVETKKEKIKPDDREEGVKQLKSYMSASLNCQFGLWTNGVDKVCYQRIRADNFDKFEDIIDIPIKGKSLEEYERLSFSELRPAFELKSVFKRCHNHIAGEDGLPKERAFLELLKVIFCKVQDEKGKNLRFYVTNKEMKSQYGLQKVKERIDGLFNEVKKYHKYKHIFEKEEEKIELFAKEDGLDRGKMLEAWAILRKVVKITPAISPMAKKKAMEKLGGRDPDDVVFFQVYIEKRATGILTSDNDYDELDIRIFGLTRFNKMVAMFHKGVFSFFIMHNMLPRFMAILGKILLAIARTVFNLMVLLAKFVLGVISGAIGSVAGFLSKLPSEAKIALAIAALAATITALAIDKSREKIVSFFNKLRDTIKSILLRMSIWFRHAFDLVVIVAESSKPYGSAGLVIIAKIYQNVIEMTEEIKKISAAAA